MKAADLFAGWGGFSLGAEQAGATVVWASNHWKLAVDAHAMNVRGATHVCQDLNQANFYDVPDIDLLLASPACQGHSQASQPRRRRFHDSLRATAWAVVSACDAKEPAHFIVENVLDFRRWRLYPAWRAALEALGYALEEHEVIATDHGVPQLRERVFIVGTRGRYPIGLRLRKREAPGVGSVLERDGVHRWRDVDAAPLKVRERIGKGRARLGDVFLTQHVTGHPGVGLDEPIRTITTKVQWCLVDGGRYRSLTVREHARCMGFPDSYRWPLVGASIAIKGLGNAVCPPVARDLVAELRRAS